MMEQLLQSFALPRRLIDPEAPVTEADTGAALLADIIARPEDDTPRLIYADWLDDHGQPERAEFCRVQCELARMARHKPHGTAVSRGGVSFPVWRSEMDHLRRRERELVLPGGKPRPHQEWWPEFGPEWLFKLAGDRGEYDRPTAYVSRGFVASVSLTLTAWLAHGPALVRAAPLEEVRLSDRHATPKDNTDFGWFKRDTGGQFSGEEAELPAALWERLRGGAVRRDRQVGVGTWRNYATREDSRHALSAAALAWAHEKARQRREELPGPRPTAGNGRKGRVSRRRGGAPRRASR